MTLEQHILMLGQKILHQQDIQQRMQKQWLIQSAIALGQDDRTFNDLTLSELHVIECIGHHEKLNVTTIAELLEMTRGAISKIAAKLLIRGLVHRQALTDNKKEVHLILTTTGKALYSIQQKKQQVAEALFFDYLQNYTQQELCFIERLLTDFSQHLEESNKWTLQIQSSRQ